MTATATPAEPEKVALLIGTFSSACGACNQDALPDEATHTRIPSWSVPGGRPGCGARFTHIAALYDGITDERLQQMRRNGPMA